MADYIIQDTTLTQIAEAIRSKTGGTDPIPVPDMAAQISGITTGGGSSEDVRYVTFMSHDGTLEYGKKAVAVGDDCADPLVRGLFPTPTRESTDQYDYTFAGWAAAANGGLNANVLKAVTEDRTVYANYVAAVRYYTVTYYDGATVLKTEQLAYGATPSYIPTKYGFAFGGWTPALETVTGSASYTATWTDVITFANATWEQIAQISAEGKAQEYFSLNETRSVTIGGMTTTARIIGFNHDDLADGSGKAGISIMLGKSIDFSQISSYKETDNYYIWSNSQTRTILNSGAGWLALPADLRAVIKPVTKISNRGYGDNSLETTTDKVWLLSHTELGFSGKTDVADGQGTRYPVFTSNASRTILRYNGSAQPYYTRSMHTKYITNNVSVYLDGTYYGSGHLGTTGNGSVFKYYVFGFCI